jgi:hypothetical protein
VSAVHTLILYLVSYRFFDIVMSAFVPESTMSEAVFISFLGILGKLPRPCLGCDSDSLRGYEWGFIGYPVSKSALFVFF